MKVVEIFKSIDGEGIRAGYPVTFIRLEGCNLRCSYCFGENQNGVYPNITLPDLTHKPLNEVNVGDVILTMENGVVKETTVTRVSNREVTDFNRLAFSNTSFIVTPEHPFFIDNDWKEVKDIVPGDKCVNATSREYCNYLLNCFKFDLYEYTKQTIQLLLDNYERFRKANSGKNNGNYNPHKYNYLRLKDAIEKGIATIDVMTGQKCDSLVVHHLDENTKNDNLDNLVIIPNAFHNQLHTRGKSFWGKRVDVSPLEGLKVVSNRNNQTTIQLGKNTVKHVIGITCEPYNTYLINDILVHNCDTKYSYENASFTEMTVDEIYDKVYKLGCKRITLTGGEPLIHEDISSLIETLCHGGFKVNIETNGAVDISPYVRCKNILITMDYKCPSSGMTDNMLLGNLDKLTKNDVLKFVVGSKEDLDTCRDIKKYTDAQIFISPVFGQIEPKEIVEYMLEHDMQDCRVQLQLHKLIWKPDQRGV